MCTGAEVRKGALLWQWAHDGQSRAAGCRRGDGDGGLQVGGACSGESGVLRGAVDLSFHLLSSCGAAATHTRIINSHLGGDCADNTPSVGGGDRNNSSPSVGGGDRNNSSPSVNGGIGARKRLNWMRLSPVARSGPGGTRGRQPAEDLIGGVPDVQRDDRQVWAECRQELHRGETETITRGVQRLHVDEVEDTAVDEGQGCDDVDGEDGCKSDDLPDIKPLGRRATRGGSGAKKGPATKPRRTKNMDNDGKGGRNFWSVGDTVTLVRAKRDQDLYIASLGTSFAHMKTAAWKWEDVRVRLQEMGVMRNAVDCGKKWDNWMQQFKKVHKFQNLSGGKDYFRLASSDEGCRRLQACFEIGGLQLRHGPERVGGGGGTMGGDGGGETTDEEQGSTKDSSFSAGSGGGYGKRKNMRQQTFEAVADVMEKHVGRRHVPKSKRLRSEEPSPSVPVLRGRYWAATNEDENDDVFMTEEEAADDTVAAPRGSTLQAKNDQVAARRLLTPPPEGQQGRGQRNTKAKEVVVDVGDEDNEPLESRRQRNAMQCATVTGVRICAAQEERPPQGAMSSTPSQPRPRNTAVDEGFTECGGGEVAQQEARVASAGAGAGSSGNVGVVAGARKEVPVVEREVARGENKGERGDDDPLLSRERRGGLARDLADRARLWVDDKAFWTTGEGRRLYDIVHRTREHFEAIASRVQAPVVSRSVVMPKSATSLTRIADPAQLQQAIIRGGAAENIVLLVLHGPCARYVVWRGVEQRGECAHTIDLNMDLPLWFAGVNIDDRPEDDDMVAYQESTVLCVANAFRTAVQMGANVDDGFISHDRLSRIADCFRLLLAACMWLMRMAGDDHRSHYEAFYFAQLVAKPTLIASMHRAFDYRRSVIRATNVVTERLGKVNATFGEYPKFIPDWASCGIKFGHDASIMGPEDAKKRDWLGSGPLEEDGDDNGENDA
ncbi:hypothetical protein CBR_g39301 [Chara braunii]|uniref:Myb/SANT-like DNA-binding domain-containing protein n=1 Tax=Chara braunii TaxID=69332 RepID=A0A388K149_CHABU|nr:hypothetical protein CBR_g39301 [Chara braunii]|eukprot:GBG63757.1 hypothetical protein CBR_g39301 [Chara braunii]